MILIETHPGRWVARDTHSAPARAIITAEPEPTGPSFRATTWHISKASQETIGVFSDLDSAFAAIVTYVAGTHGVSRPPG